jgi:SAM-dependent methyltransferase
MNDLLTPAPFWTRFDQLCADRPDIRVLGWILRERTSEWINSIGVLCDEGLSSLVPPIPPLELRQIVAAPEPEIFLWTGYIDTKRIMELYNEHAGIPDPKILDFGCGCGRMVRFLNQASACDINPDLVSWCQRNLPKIDTRPNNSRPPLPFSDKFFDLVYCMSLFTHLPEKLAQIWLHEIHRVLKPNGLAIITTHGIPALNIIKTSSQHQEMFGISSEEVEKILQGFEEDPFVFKPYQKEVLAMAKAGE